jgi:hypothetical protein
MPTWAAPGARKNVVMAEVRNLTMLFTSRSVRCGAAAHSEGGRRMSALLDVNAYGAVTARAAFATARPASQGIAQQILTRKGLPLNQAGFQIAGSTARDM